jgi:hypothetical protein
MTLAAEDALHHFLRSSTNFFEKETWSNLEVGDPSIEFGYVLPDAIHGWVKVTGIATGWIMFSAPESMVAELVRQKVGELHEGDCKDYMRELASVIVSNARRELGEKLIIEIPESTHLSALPKPDPRQPVYIVPMIWKTHQASMAMALEQEME